MSNDQRNNDDDDGACIFFVFVPLALSPSHSLFQNIYLSPFVLPCHENALFFHGLQLFLIELPFDMDRQ